MYNDIVYYYVTIVITMMNYTLQRDEMKAVESSSNSFSVSPLSRAFLKCIQRTILIRCHDDRVIHGQSLSLADSILENNNRGGERERGRGATHTYFNRVQHSSSAGPSKVCANRGCAARRRGDVTMKRTFFREPVPTLYQCTLALARISRVYIYIHIMCMYTCASR